MKKEYNFLDLFEKFIIESRTGKRRKIDGSKIRFGTIELYKYVKKELIEFSQIEKFTLRINDVRKASKRELASERLYWKRFHRKYSDYLYAKGCFDNYVGAHFKVIRTFCNYLKNEKEIYNGDFHKFLYIRNENIPIIVLSQEQLHFLANNKEFEHSLPHHLTKAKDIFVFGCITGLRFSDLMNLSNRNIERMNSEVYLRVRSLKTFTDTRIKLIETGIDIIKKYKYFNKLLPAISNNRLNLNLKEICLRAGWVYEIGKKRGQRGQSKNLNKKGKVYRFCDLVTTHTMRRTAITTLLSRGVSEIIVRKLSGHSSNSKEFFKYVNYAQKQIDEEVESALDFLDPHKNLQLKSTEI